MPQNAPACACCPAGWPRSPASSWFPLLGAADLAHGFSAAWRSTPAGTGGRPLGPVPAARQSTLAVASGLHSSLSGPSLPRVG
jgi:hypothetical protein